MEPNQKAFRLSLIVMAFGALLGLAGAVIGKSALGWTLFASGMVLIAVVLAWRFSQLKELLISEKFRVIISAVVLAVLLLTALVILLLSNSGTNADLQTNHALPPISGTPLAGGMPVPMGGATATETATVTATATAAVTSTPEPTLTATTTAEIFVCLNENTQIGYNLRVAPADDAAFGGLLDWGACFTVDGKAAGFPGWYHVASGQDGQAGVSIEVDETVYQLWVKGYYLESFGNDLESLPEIVVAEN